MVYADPGYLLYVQDGALLAHEFDVAGLRLVGDAKKIADGVAYYRTLGSAGVSVSRVGSLAFQGSIDDFELVWYDRQSNPTPTGWPNRNFGSLSLSPDDQKVLVDVVDPRLGTNDIWSYDVARASNQKLTTDLTSENRPIWSPDGRQFLFRWEREGAPSIYTHSLDTGISELRVSDRGPLMPEDWSRDGRVVYAQQTRGTGLDLWISGPSDPKPQPFSTKPSIEEWGARFSPDGAWLAFVSDESGQPEVYVAPVRAPGARRQISNGGGTSPKWRRNGSELFYASLDQRAIMSAAVAWGTAPRFGVPARLVRLGSTPAARDRARSMVYDVDSKGQRFLVSLPVGEPGTSRITFVQNWLALLQR